MRSFLVVSVLALLLLDCVQAAPQHVGRILRNSSSDDSESEIPGHDPERTEYNDEVSSTEDNQEIPTLEDRNSAHDSTLHTVLASDYDYNDSSPSENPETKLTSSPTEITPSPYLSSGHTEILNSAPKETSEGKESFPTTTVSTDSSESFRESDFSSPSSVRDDIDSIGSEEAEVKDKADTVNLPPDSKPGETAIFDTEIIKSDGDENNNDGSIEDEFRNLETDDEDGNIRRSDEIVEERERNDHHSTSLPLPSASSLPQETSATNHSASDRLVLNSEKELDKHFEGTFEENSPIVHISTTEIENEPVLLNTTRTTAELERLKFRNEELDDLLTISGETESLAPTERTTPSAVTERREVASGTSSDDTLGLHTDKDPLERTTLGVVTTTLEPTEEQTSPASHSPSDSEVLEGRSASILSTAPESFAKEDTTDKQMNSEVPKVSGDIASIMTTVHDDSTSFSPATLTLNSGSDDLTSNRSGSTLELTSEGIHDTGDLTDTTIPADPTFAEGAVPPVKSTSDDTDVEIKNDDKFSTVADSLPHSDTGSDIHHTGVDFPGTSITSSAPSFETTESDERSLELKILDSTVDTADRLDTNTPPNDKTTTSSLFTTVSKDPTTTTKERTTTLVWHGPTVLPRQTTTTSSEVGTAVVETESASEKEEGTEMRQDDGKDFLDMRFSDRYLSGDNMDMVAAVQFLHYHDKASSEQCFKLVDAHWNYATNLTEENKRKQLQQTLEYSLFHKEAWKNATSFAWKAFNDTLLRRWFKSLSILGNAALPEDKLTEFNQLKAEMKNTYSTAKVCPFRRAQEGIVAKCNLSLEPDLQSILMKSRDYDELVHVWKSWRDAAGKPIRNKFLRFVELSNEAATLNGFPDTGDMWREAYESDSFQQDLDLLWEQLRPLYEHLHAYVRRKLINEYGADKILEDGPIPAHLFGNMWAQSWVALLDITQPFPGKPSVDVTPMMEVKNMSALDMFLVSEEFFISLGLKPMPDDFWKYSLIEKPKDREIICHASAWDFCNGKDYRIKQCTDITMEDLITVHHEMGHIQYFLQYARQPNVFREGANPGFHEAIGDVLALSVSTPKHLLSIGLLDEIADDPEGDLNFLLRTALEKVSFLPSGYLIDLWRWGLFSGEIKPEEMNAKWWELRLKYQGICPPVERTEEDFDPGAKYHVAGNVPYIRYFVSFVIQFQFHKVLCDAAGHTGPLYKCDVYRSKEAGQILSQVMELGSSEHWSEAMRIMTGGAQTKMDAQPIMEYFEPLLNWLIEQNKNETLGWRSNDANICP